MNILVTGGLGFIGSHFIRLCVANKTHVTNLDMHTYAANPKNVLDIAESPSYSEHHEDICNARGIVEELCPDVIVNFAAETHVDRSIDHDAPFLRSNVEGTHALLDAARRNGVQRFVQVSTDEVYGALGPMDDPWDETSPLRPRSPYSASKAAADLLALSYHTTYGMDIVITRSCNNFGPMQYPEKLIPVVIRKALQDELIPVYGDGSNVREWIYVTENCEWIWQVMMNGLPGGVYNIGSSNEMTNIELVGRILDILGKPRSLMEFVPDRPGHDFRYSMRCDKIHEAGEVSPTSFAVALENTVSWYQSNPLWWS